MTRLSSLARPALLLLLVSACEVPSGEAPEQVDFDATPDSFERGLTFGCVLDGPCTVTGDTDVFASTYRVGMGPTSRGAFAQVFEAVTAGTPSQARFPARILRPFSVPASELVQPQLHVRIHTSSGAAPEPTPANLVSEGALDLATFGSGGSTVPTTFPGGIATVPLHVVDHAHPALVAGDRYVVVVSTDDLPASATGTLLVGLGALVDGDGTRYAGGDAWRLTERRTAVSAPWLPSRARPAGTWQVAVEVGAVDVTPIGLAPSAVTIAVGNTTSFAMTGGYGAPTFSVVSGGGAFAGSSYTAPATSGSATVRVTDQLGNRAEAVVTINAAITIGPTPVTLVAGSTQVFGASGGVPPYSFSIASGGGALLGSTYLVPPVPGSAAVRVTDSLGNTTTAAVTILPSLAISPASVVVVAGATQVFGATGGVGPYSFSVFSGGGSLTGATYTAPGSPGSATVRATDSLGNTSDAAVTIASGKVYVAAAGTNGIYRSSNASSWTFVASSGGESAQAADFHNGKFVATGTNGFASSSADGQTWTNATTTQPGNHSRIAWGGGVWFAGGANGMMSTNGSTWVPANSPGASSTPSFTNGQFWSTSWVGLCPCSGAVYRSSAVPPALPTGGQWSQQGATLTFPFYELATGGGFHYIVTTNGLYRTSTASFSPAVYALNGVSLVSIAESGTGILVVAGTGGLYSSTDAGTTWQARTSALPAGVFVRWTGQRFIAWAGTTLVASTDGVNWPTIGTLPAGTQGVAVKE